MAFDLDNPESFRGAQADAVRAFLRGLGWAPKPTRNKLGERWALPRRGGDQVRLMDGNQRERNPIKQGPYLVVSMGGIKSAHIPLEGNPTLPGS